MNCQDITRLVDSRSPSGLTESELRDCETHALSCRQCAAVWIVHERLAAMPVPSMPPEFATQCETLARKRARGSVLRLVPRRMMVLAGSFVVLAAAAGVITVNFIAPQREQVADAPPRTVTPVVPVQPTETPLAPPAPPPVAAVPLVAPARAVAQAQLPPSPARQVPQPDPGVHQVENGEPAMSKPASIAVAATAVVAAVASQAQTVQTTGDGRQASPEQIIASNDLDKDGFVTKEEATTARKTLILMWTFYDMDRDGRVNAAEVARATDAMLVATAQEKITGEPQGGPAMIKPDLVITSNDKNGDGIVTREEATQTAGGLIRLWDIYDLNKDGKVDAAEIAKAQGY